MTSKNKEQIVLEAVRLAELNLQTETNLMIASDQRSTTLSGLLFAVVALVASGSMGNQNEWVDDLSLMFLGCAVLLSVFSARSVKIFAPGLKFDAFRADVVNARDYLTVLSELGRHYDKCSDDNRRLMAKNARYYNAALWFVSVGFLVGLIPWAFHLVSALSVK